MNRARESALPILRFKNRPQKSEGEVQSAGDIGSGEGVSAKDMHDILPVRMRSTRMLHFSTVLSCFLVASVFSFVPDKATCRSVTDRVYRAIEGEDEYDRFAKLFDESLRGSYSEISGGSELSPYYRRDRLDFIDQLPVADPSGVSRLLEERYRARTEDKNYTTVATIDRVLLREHGVRAYDQPAIWTRRKEPPRTHLRKQAQRKVAQMKEIYGPTGHPYRQVGRWESDLFCSLNHSDVHALLSRRSKCRMEGRYELADAIKFELWIHGVHVDDVGLRWTVDRPQSLTGAEFDVAVNGSKPIRSPVYGFHAVESNDSLIESDANSQRTLQRIHQLLAERADALVRREDSVATFLSLELLRTYGVRVDDEKHMWWFVESTEDPSYYSSYLQTLGKVGVATPLPALLFADETSDFSSLIRYRESDHSLSLEHPSLFSRVQRLVQERIQKREEAKYLEADALRQELWKTYNVGVNDRLQQFSVGGVYDEHPPAEHQFV